MQWRLWVQPQSGGFTRTCEQTNTYVHTRAMLQLHTLTNLHAYKHIHQDKCTDPRVLTVGIFSMQ